MTRPPSLSPEDADALVWACEAGLSLARTRHTVASAPPVMADAEERLADLNRATHALTVAKRLRDEVGAPEPREEHR